MRRPLRQRGAIVAIGVLLSVVGSFGASAAQPRLVTKCQAPDQASGVGQGTLTCDVRANGFASFKDVKAAIKGEAGDLTAIFEPFDPTIRGTTTAYLIQLMPNSRRATLSQMGDAVVTFADVRGGKRRFMAYTFANDPTLVAESGASKNEFARQIIAVKPASTAIQLYKSAFLAVEALAKEGGERKALVILGDGTSDDTSFSHEQVVAAARDAGITIHVLGYADDRTERPKFEKLARLAADTGGFATEIKQGPGKDRDFTKDVISSRFVGEVLENGGTVKADLEGSPGTQTLELVAELDEGEPLKADEKIEVPAAPAPAFEPADPGPTELGASDGMMAWIDDNSILVVALGALLGLGVIGVVMYGRSLVEKDAATGEGSASLAAGDGADEPQRDIDARPVIYGWLEMLDGNASRHPLCTTNVRVGRHRDNDICLQNDSISRRHAVLHYNSDTRRFVITDLGAQNGVIVNRTKYQSRELQDGDTVELGEVRLRFRADTGLHA